MCEKMHGIPVIAYNHIFVHDVSLCNGCSGGLETESADRVFVLHAGVAGVAWASLIARVFSAVVITVLCFGKKNGVAYRWRWIIRWNSASMKQILGIAVPNGLEKYHNLTQCTQA